MSIVQLSKITLVGSSPEKKEVLENLQDLGCLHIIPLAQAGTSPDRGVGSRGREALHFLLASPQKIAQVTKHAQFEPVKIEHDALIIRDRLDALTIERDNLIDLISERMDWGDFKPPKEAELGGMKLWLYRVPNNQIKIVESSGLNWQTVGHDERFDYVIVISQTEPPPEKMPVPPLKPDSRSLIEMESRLEQIELAIAETQMQRESMTRWCLLLARSIDRLDDRAALESAAKQTRDAGEIFGLQAWVPNERLAELRSFAEKRGLVFDAVAPAPGEIPPTKFRNPERISGGEELVSFYMTPSYWLCDPSPVVFFSFAIFFAMIMSDAGYGFLLALLTLVLWKKMGVSQTARRWRMILAWISGLTVLYGILVGSYFGVEPRSSFLKSLHVVKMTNYGQMMLISVLIGAAHVILANLMNAWRFGRSLKCLAPLGWALMILSGLAMTLASKFGSSALLISRAGIAGLAVGALLIVLFTSPELTFGKRLVGGLLGLTRVTSAFGDVLSYLRLFALGLASASLAAVFNGMAHSLYQKVAGLGLLFAILVLLLGHVVNFVLSVSSGFIHGLRLNVIEFFNWGVQEEGNIYRPFMRKESATWNR